jgi:hypothetical protein
MTSQHDAKLKSHSPMRKPEDCPVVCVKLFFSLDASRRLHKHDTCAPSAYKPHILLSNPTRIPCDSRVHKLAILKIRVTRVVNCVRQTFLSDTLTRLSRTKSSKSLSQQFWTPAPTATPEKHMRQGFHICI